MTLSFAQVACTTREQVDLILANGNIYTLNDAMPQAKAIAICGDRIVAVGWNEEIKTRFNAKRVIDLRGNAAYPGFTDAHAHLESLGGSLVNLNLEGTTSVEQIRQLVAERAASLPAGAWLRGRSWDQNDWEVKAFPTHTMLDDVAGDHPVFLRRIDGHAGWANQRALDAAKISKSTNDPQGGKILRDADGKPTGVLIDNAMDLIDSVMPAPTTEERTAYVEKAVQECLRFGLTEVHDMGVDAELIGIYKKLIAERRFPFRVYAAIDGINKTWRAYKQRMPEIGKYDNRLTVRALKLYADGALGSRGAALLEPYSDERNNTGLLLTPTDSLVQAASDALERGYQVCTHAIGDRANRAVLDIYERVFKANETSARDARFRIEHAQVVSMSDIPRFAKLGVLPSMQQTHCTSDMYWAEQRLGAGRVGGAYAWRHLMNAGSIIPGGSDFPVESANPLLGFYAAITRQDAKGFPDGGWYPDQRMTRDEALKSFTKWAAFAAFEEDLRGSLEVGKLADIVILSNDIMHCEPKEILATTVLYTIVGGEIVYEAKRQ
jgi:predicted amidohydrolase YtcJ